MWTYFILPDNLWGRALTAHFVGLVILLLTFSFRSAGCCSGVLFFIVFHSF
jgi:hypothetical protein